MRRVELWKIIHNGGNKPDKVSDRSWNLLAKQMDSPTQIRKSEICSRANASRVNFGRTGPSREVGVKERLRRKLRRSPDPEEINFEMARDKGYGGRSTRKKVKGDVLQGGEHGTLFLVDDPRRIDPSKNVGEDANEDNLNLLEEEQYDMHADDEEVGHSVRAFHGGSEAMKLGDEEISRHALVQSLLQRLEALEGRNTQAAMGKSSVQEASVGNVQTEMETSTAEIERQEKHVRNKMN